MAKKYSTGAQEYVKKAVREMKQGKLTARGGRHVGDRKQAIAIGLSEAREHGEKVPKKRSPSRSRAASKSHARTSTRSRKS